MTTLSVAVRTTLSSAFELDVALEVAPGITIVFGASGSGKTTLLRAIAGLLVPARGRIQIGDRVLFDAETGVNVPVEDRHVGYVFQQLALFPHLTVRENIGYGLPRLAVDRAAKVEAIAADFHIAHLLERPPDRISGGERQRAALARSLVTEPGVLLLDEPLSALDHVTQSRIMADLRQWNRRHDIPVLYVTHNHREVFALGERVVVLAAGRVLADGTPQQVMETPTAETVAQLAGFENLIEATVVGSRPEAGTMECQPRGTNLEIEAPLAAVTIGSQVRLAIRAGDILVATEQPRGLSARNIMPGIIRSVDREGTTVRLQVDTGMRLEVHVTPVAATTLALAPERRVWLVIKTHSCRLVTD